MIAPSKPGLEGYNSACYLFFHLIGRFPSFLGSGFTLQSFFHVHQKSNATKGFPLQSLTQFYKILLSLSWDFFLSKVLLRHNSFNQSFPPTHRQCRMAARSQIFVTVFAEKQIQRAAPKICYCHPPVCILYIMCSYGLQLILVFSQALSFSP